MKTLIAEYAAARDRKARYRRTVHELRSMSLDVALDLDIFREDAEKIAARAVYGR